MISTPLDSSKVVNHRGKHLMQLQDLELELELEVKERPLRTLQLEGNTCQSTSFASPNTTMIDALRRAEQSLRLLPHMLVILCFSATAGASHNYKCIISTLFDL